MVTSVPSIRRSFPLRAMERWADPDDRCGDHGPPAEGTVRSKRRSRSASRWKRSFGGASATSPISSSRRRSPCTGSARTAASSGRTRPSWTCSAMPREEYVGRPIAEFHADPPMIEDILRRLAAREELHDYEARLRCKDGSIKHVQINSNVRWEDGRFVHTRCFTHDITERKRSERRSAASTPSPESWPRPPRSRRPAEDARGDRSVPGLGPGCALDALTPTRACCGVRASGRRPSWTWPTSRPSPVGCSSCQVRGSLARSG